ncbi:hypothetical protein HY734_02920 [Candidatus Uhrbacteria bacterium]|nr:hypothetical protein [Candidatus Uhrbacteria bacterium]
MKIFAIYARVVLSEKLSELDAFRQKYNDAYDPHITLKQPCWIEEDRVPELKRAVASFFQHLEIPGHRMDLCFEVLLPDQTAGEKKCIIGTGRCLRLQGYYFGSRPDGRSGKDCRGIEEAGEHDRFFLLLEGTHVYFGTALIVW